MTTRTLTTADQAKTEAFLEKAMGDLSGAMAFVMCSIGDRLGLFKDLAANGSATSAELADRVNINERYAREWLAGVASAGYLEFDAASRRYSLPPEHAPVCWSSDFCATHGCPQHSPFQAVMMASSNLWRHNG